jgi:hypothetical protein
LAALVAVSAAAQGFPEDPRSLLRRADSLYEATELEAALAAYEQVLAAADAPREVMAQAYAGAGLCSAALERGERAEWAFTRLLALDPGWVLPRELPPKMREPLAKAKAYWVGRPVPALSASYRDPVDASEPLTVQATLTGDVLGLATSLAVRWQSGAKEGVVVQPLGPEQVALTIEAGELTPPHVRLRVQALNDKRSVIYESPWYSAAVGSSAAPVARNVPEVSPPSAEMEVVRPLGARRHDLRAHALLLSEPIQRRIGVEAGLSLALARNVDLFAAAAIGQSTGARVGFTFHPWWLEPDRPLLPFVQLRAALYPGDSTYGGGLWLGASLEAGPGRIVAGAMGELYSAPTHILPYALLAAAGYQLDVWR